MSNKKQFKESLRLNRRTYRNYYERLKLLCKSMFKWENLPNEIDPDFIENNLFHEGKLAFFHDETYGYIVTKCNDSGMLNIYDKPVYYHCYANGYNKNVKAKDLVIIGNNIEYIPTASLIQLFVERFYEIERTIDTNLKQQKTPCIVVTDEKGRLALENLMMKYDGNQPFIYGNNKLDIRNENIKVLNTQAPFLADKLEDIKQRKWQECLNMLGINNANTSKKARLNIEEVTSNNQLIGFSSDVFLQTRQKAAELINDRFGTNIKVSLREEINLNNNDNSVKEGVEE